MSVFKGKEEFIQFLSNCDTVTFDKAIGYINVVGFLEGLYNIAPWIKDKDILLEAMEYANGSYDSAREYLENKYGNKIY